MQEGLPDEVDREYLRELTLSDLVGFSDTYGEDTVESLLSEGVSVAAAYLGELGKQLEREPAIVYEPHESGVNYDPYHDRGEALIVGGPRGILRGGEEVLGERGIVSQKSLLSILSKGLVHSYNHHLVTEHFERYGGGSGASSPGTVELYDKFRMLNPAVDEGFAQLYALYIEGDVTDAVIREAYVDRWAEWFRRTEFDVHLFEATAYTVGDRVDDATGSERERFVSALEIQEPLIRNGDVSVLAERL